MAKYIVTGGAGFVGSHTVDKLLSLGHEVVVIDDLSAGKMENVPDGVTFIKADIGNWDELSQTFPYWQGAGGIFHFAACARIQPSIKEPLLTNQTNVNGTLHVLEMARMCNIPNLVYAASSSYYGIEPELPCKETAEGDPQTPYSATKYMGEVYCKTWWELYGIRTVCLRYFNVYGARSPVEGGYAPVIGRFFKQGFTGQDLTIVGDGEQRRDFTYITDVVNANLAAMQKLTQNFQLCAGLTINIGTGNSYSINELAGFVVDVLQGARVKNAKTVHVPKRTGESISIVADNSLARKVLGWQPATDLKMGLTELSRYYVNRPDALK